MTRFLIANPPGRVPFAFLKWTNPQLSKKNVRSYMQLVSPFHQMLNLYRLTLKATSRPMACAPGSFDFSQPTFISWLGVMVYLSQAAAAAVFKIGGPASAFQRISSLLFQPRVHASNRQISFYPSLAGSGYPTRRTFQKLHCAG